MAEVLRENNGKLERIFAYYASVEATSDSAADVCDSWGLNTWLQVTGPLDTPQLR